MSRCRFLVDECVPSSLARGLRRRLPEVTVLQVGEPNAPAKGSSDPELLQFCERHRQLLITTDRATMATWVSEHLRAGHHTSGVLFIGPNASLGQILDDLTLIYEASEDSEWVDVLRYLPLSA
jgi:hypothetical protein